MPVGVLCYRLVSRRCHKIVTLAMSTRCTDAPMRALTPGSGHRHRQVSPLIALDLPIVPSPSTPCGPAVVLAAMTTRRVCFRLRLRVAGSPPQDAESGSLTYGPIVRLQLLPTPPRGDAVTFGYRVLAYSDPDFHRANQAPSRAHSPRLCRGIVISTSDQRVVLR